MTWSLDARIPLVIVADAASLAASLADGRPAAVLASAPATTPHGAVAAEGFDLSDAGHAAACACCAGRGPVALALDRLFLARVRAAVPWFERVVALADTESARAALAETLRNDAVTAARFRAALG
jgi:hypothetical protein